ncbi:MAG: biopolymer transporter ExbD [Candidatus Omnitrophica bacterium]|nr:biopolymer transporter ExbD [Candidatus Omnitrophota bacterium]MBU4488953.1 biopolymer transporter ExbD [Candidatus Omnitrophota bacterium]MCG2705248.1 biopolymer transporter ExbD [Candidatus Omnitrophota bacterium]
MRFKRRTEIVKGQIDIAPLIDVVFQLLIFFMLTSSFIVQPGIKVNLPKAVTSEVLHEKSLIILITGSDMVYLNERAITTKELDSRLRIAAKEKKPLLIKADRRASMGKIVEIWDMCRDAGITQINIATSQEIK